jgi:hypothetical protein
MGPVRRHRLDHVHHLRRSVQSQSCPAGTAGENGNPVISLANAGLSQFSSPSFTAPPLVYGNFNSLYNLVYPNSAAPYGSDEPLLRTKVTEHTEEEFVRLDFASSIADMPLKGDIGVRVAHVNTESSGYQTFDGGMTFSPIVEGNEYTNVLPSLNTTLAFDGHPAAALRCFHRRRQAAARLADDRLQP